MINIIQNLNAINAGACHEMRIFAPMSVSTDPSKTHMGHIDGNPKKKKTKLNIQGCNVFSFHWSTSILNEVYLSLSVISVSAPTQVIGFTINESTAGLGLI